MGNGDFILVYDCKKKEASLHSDIVVFSLNNQKDVFFLILKKKKKKKRQGTVQLFSLAEGAICATPPPCFGMKETDREPRQGGEDQAEMGKKLGEKKTRVRKAGTEEIK